MKYIRTKDGRIIELNEKDYLLEEKIKISVLCGKKIEVDKIADTIEELCDEFVYKYLVYSNYEDVLKIVNDKECIYGAIWTEKGLIYVAKMNDKGELELL